MRRHLLLLSSLLLAGCFSKQYFPYVYAPSAVPATERPQVLVNAPVVREILAAPSPASLEALDAEIGARLEANGYRVDTSSVSRSRLAGISAVLPRLGARPVPESLKDLQGATGCDLVIVPVVEFRFCEAQNQNCRWDGVVREIPHSDDTQLVMSGGFAAVSLLVNAYTCDGRAVLTSMGGIDVARYATTKLFTGNDSASPVAGAGFSRLYMNDRTDYLDDPAMRAEAIALALHPLVAMAEYPDDPTPYDPSRLQTRAQ
ncbi:MAG: hypothetical protein RIT81_26975 [Deltaproteobacteria bacterium]